MGLRMSRPSDQYRAEAQKARSAANTLSRDDMKRAALDIADGWERLAETAEKQPRKPQTG